MGGTEVEPGLREVVMKVALASGEGHTELENLLRMLEIPQERNRVLHSLGYSANRDVLSRVLAFSLDPRLRDQESVMVIESVCQNRIGVRLAWDFFKEHVKEFFSRYPSSSATTLKLAARERSARRKKISASTCTGKTVIWIVWLGSWKLRKTRRLVNLRSYYQLL